MDLSDFQRKAVILIFLSILVGSILLARKEPLKNQTQMLQEKKTNTVTKQIAQPQTKIDINTADMETLMQLPGIGPKYANEMINYRNTHGPFKYKEDLLNIPGIGENRFERIKDMIALPDKATATGSPDNISSRIQTSENKTQIISPDNKIDLNSATLEQLIYIPDIGPKTAKSIMDYRDTNGKFNNLEELKKNIQNWR